MGSARSVFRWASTQTTTPAVTPVLTNVTATENQIRRCRRERRRRDAGFEQAGFNARSLLHEESQSQAVSEKKP